MYERLVVPEERLNSVEAQRRGRKFYLRHCAQCHGGKADGKPAQQPAFNSDPRDFTDPLWRQGTSPRRVYYGIREGLRGTPMPAWKAALSEDDCWDLVSYLLSVSRAPEGSSR